MTGFFWLAALLYLFLDNITRAVTVDNVRGNAVSVLGYIKLFISFIKYMPQVYWNYKR
jgi:hypothetical protein